MQEARFALRRPRANTLPEPLDDFVVDLVASIIGVLGPVVTVAKQVV